MNRPLTPWERALLAQQRVAHLVTVNAAGEPAVVPVVYAFDSAHVITPLDGKPKRVGVMQLRRVRDIAANAQVALVIDHYDEAWSQLAWVQLRGTATLIEEGPRYAPGMALLAVT